MLEIFVSLAERVENENPISGPFFKYSALDSVIEFSVRYVSFYFGRCYVHCLFAYLSVRVTVSFLQNVFIERCHMTYPHQRIEKQVPMNKATVHLSLPKKRRPTKCTLRNRASTYRIFVQPLPSLHERAKFQGFHEELSLLLGPRLDSFVQRQESLPSVYSISHDLFPLVQPIPDLIQLFGDIVNGAVDRSAVSRSRLSCSPQWYGRFSLVVRACR